MFFFNFQSRFYNNSRVLFFQLKIMIIDAIMPDVSRFYFRTLYISVHYYFLSIYFCYNNPITLCRYVKEIRLSRAMLPLARQPDSYLFAGFCQTTRWLHFVFNFNDQIIPEELDKEYHPVHFHSSYRLRIWRFCRSTGPVPARRRTRDPVRYNWHTRIHMCEGDDRGADVYMCVWNLPANSRGRRVDGWVVGRSNGRAVERRPRPYGVHIPFLG